MNCEKCLTRCQPLTGRADALKPLWAGLFRGWRHVVDTLEQLG